MKTFFHDFRYVVNLIHHTLCNTCVIAILTRFTVHSRAPHDALTGVIIFSIFASGSV